MLIGYPVNPIIEAAAVPPIRRIIIIKSALVSTWPMAEPRVVRQTCRRLRCSMGQGTRMPSGVAQAMATPSHRRLPGRLSAPGNVPPNFNAFLNFRHISKWIEQVPFADAVPDALRRALHTVRNGRPRPVVVEIPTDVFQETSPSRSLQARGGDALGAGSSGGERGGAGAGGRRNARCSMPARGAHAQAWPELRELAELLAARSTASNIERLCETHPLSLGSGGRSIPKTVHDFLQFRRHFRHRL